MRPPPASSRRCGRLDSECRRPERLRPALRLLPGIALAVAVAGIGASPALAQDNYEIQVYGAETVPAGFTMVELHSNYTFRGGDEAEQGVRPTAHALHETLEITHGFTPWFEAALYTFTSARADYGWDWVGNHCAADRRISLAPRHESSRPETAHCFM